MGATPFPLFGVVVLHDSMMVVSQNNLSKKLLVLGLPMGLEHIIQLFPEGEVNSDGYIP